MSEGETAMQETVEIPQPTFAVYPRMLYAVDSDGVMATNEVEEAQLRSLGFLAHDEFHAAQLAAERQEQARAAKAEAERICQAEADAEREKQEAKARELRAKMDAEQAAKVTPEEREWAFKASIRKAKVDPLMQTLIRAREHRRALIDEIAIQSRGGEIDYAQEKRLVELGETIRAAQSEIASLEGTPL